MVMPGWATAGQKGAGEGGRRELVRVSPAPVVEAHVPIPRPRKGAARAAATSARAAGAPPRRDTVITVVIAAAAAAAFPAPSSEDRRR